MLQAAYDLLYSEYQKCLAAVAAQPFYIGFAREKWRHSLQVMGAGNYIIKRINWLKNKSPQYIDMVKTAIFLHDVCRFAEISLMAVEHKKLDHGIAGCQLLRQTPPFNDIRIWLPIKHHGHLITELYADAEYQNIADKNLQAEVEQIAFIIRDADKIANLHMLTQEKGQWLLFLGKAEKDYQPQADGLISDIIKREAFEGKTVNRDARLTTADRIVGYLSWFTDINYRASLDFCQRLNVIEKLIKIFADHCIDEPFKTQYIDYFTTDLRQRHYLD